MAATRMMTHAFLQTLILRVSCRSPMYRINILISQPCRSKPRKLISLACAALCLCALNIVAAGREQSAANVKQSTTGGVAQEVQSLEPGSLIQRELAGGEVHYYVIRLPVGRYIHLAVTQLGIDVVMTLISTDGRDTLNVDYANGTRGQEEVSLAAEQASEYQLQISPKDKSAAPGQYRVAIVEERAGIATDGDRIAAERDFAAGESLRRQGITAPLEQAVVKYEAARQSWQEVGDAGGEARALLGRGKAYFYLSRLADSIESYEAALHLFESLPIPARLDVAIAHQFIGISQLSMADHQAALSHFQLALQLFRDENDQKFEGAALYQIGRVYYLEGDLNQTLNYYNQARSIRQALNDRPGEAYTLLGLGRVYANRFGDNAQAMALYNQALLLLTAPPENRLAAQGLGDVGRLYFSQGEYDRALKNYNKGLALVADGDKLVRAELLTYVGMVYTTQGRQQEAIDKFYKVALTLQQAGGDRIGAGNTLKNMGVAYSSVGNYGQALENYRQALNIWRDVLYPTAEADTRYEIARVQNRIGSTASLRDAGEQLDLALPILETLRTKISNQTLRTSFFSSIQKYYELHIDVLMRLYAQTKDKRYEARALGYSERARARSLLDTLIEADAKIREGVAAPELLQQEEALQRKLSGLAQSAILDNRHTQTQAEAQAQSITSLLKQYSELEAKIREKSPRYASLVYPEPVTLADIQTKILDDDQMLLEYALGTERSYLWAITPSSVDSYVLPKRAEIEAAAERVRTLLTARNQMVKGETNLRSMERVRRADTEYYPAATALSQTLLGKVEALPQATRLLIVGDGELQYLPFAALPLQTKATTAPAVSRAGAQAQAAKWPPLLLSHEVETQPSVSLLAELRRHESGVERHTPQKLIAVIADPVFNEDDERFDDTGAQSARRSGKEAARPLSPPGRTTNDLSVNKSRATLNRAGLIDARGHIARLPFTRREADAILALAPSGAGVKIVDFGAKIELVTGGELAQYRIIHFATHGLLDKEHPELSGILLSLFDEQRRPREGFLQMHEVYNLRLPVEMVVLSACETGIGKMVRGEGLAAMSRGFMYAGAKRVVASLWEVNDSSTAELMTHFYRHLLSSGGSRPAAALRAAQIEIWRKDSESSPYFWAAFIIQGDSK
jgi:tetratricopeptide (TPR) repeat protein